MNDPRVRAVRDALYRRRCGEIHDLNELAIVPPKNSLAELYYESCREMAEVALAASDAVTYEQVGWHRLDPKLHQGVAWQHAQPADTRTWEPVFRQVPRAENGGVVG